MLDLHNVFIGIALLNHDSIYEKDSSSKSVDNLLS